MIGSMLPPSIKDAGDRGVARRQAGGTRAIPKDLEGKPAEASAWLAAYDAADRTATAAAGSSDEIVDPLTGEVYRGGAKPPARAPRGHRGKRATADTDV